MIARLTTRTNWLFQQLTFITNCSIMSLRRQVLWSYMTLLWY